MRPRVIPTIAIEDGYVVKTTKFRNPRYIGDPINTVKILNEKMADEIALLDIGASHRGTPIDFNFVEDVVSEAFMPVSYGGGVRRLSDAARLFSLGVEKVVVNTGAFLDTSLVSAISGEYGAQAVIGAVDVVKPRFGSPKVSHSGARQSVSLDCVARSVALEAAGAGEILLTAVAHEGLGTGYDLESVRRVSSAVGVPVIAHGGARDLGDFARAVEAGASAVAAGSMFVYHGVHRAVLVTYPADVALVRAFAEVGHG